MDGCCAKPHRYKTCRTLSSSLNPELLPEDKHKEEMTTSLSGAWSTFVNAIAQPNLCYAELAQNCTGHTRSNSHISDKLLVCWNNFANIYLGFYFVQTYPCLLPVHLQGRWRPSQKKKNYKMTQPSIGIILFGHNSLLGNLRLSNWTLSTAVSFQDLSWEKSHDFACFSRKIFSIGNNDRSSGKVWQARSHRDCLYSWSKDQTQNSKSSSQSCTLYTGLYSHLNQIHLSCDQNMERFPSHHKEDFLHRAGTLFPTLRAIDRGPLHQAKIHTTLPQSIIRYLLHAVTRPFLPAFCRYYWGFSYLTTLVPFRNTWMSTA